MVTRGSWSRSSRVSNRSPVCRSRCCWAALRLPAVCCSDASTCPMQRPSYCRVFFSFASSRRIQSRHAASACGARSLRKAPRPPHRSSQVFHRSLPRHLLMRHRRGTAWRVRSLRPRWFNPPHERRLEHGAGCGFRRCPARVDALPVREPWRVHHREVGSRQSRSRRHTGVRGDGWIRGLVSLGLSMVGRARCRWRGRSVWRAARLDLLVAASERHRDRHRFDDPRPRAGILFRQGVRAADRTAVAHTRPWWLRRRSGVARGAADQRAAADRGADRAAAISRHASCTVGPGVAHGRRFERRRTRAWLQRESGTGDGHGRGWFSRRCRRCIFIALLPRQLERSALERPGRDGCRARDLRALESHRLFYRCSGVRRRRFNRSGAAGGRRAVGVPLVQRSPVRPDAGHHVVDVVVEARAGRGAGRAFADALKGGFMSGLGGLNKSPHGVVLGLVQLQLPVVATPDDLAAQTAGIVALVGKARRNLPGMDLVVFPEYSLHGLSMDTNPAIMCRLDGPEVAAFKRACVEHRIWGCFSIMEFNPHGNPYNSSLIIDDQGAIKLYYRKLHPWVPVEPWEPGDLGIPVCDGPNGSKLALIICHDGMFPEMARECAYKGAEIIIRNAAYTAPIRHA